MNPQLLRKELGGLSLVLWLILAIWGLHLCYAMLTGFPDRKADADGELEDIIAYMMLFGILIGISLFGQEREHQTMPFLDGLPLTRLTILWHKFIAACTVIGFNVFLVLSFAIFFYWLASDSLSPPFPLRSSLGEAGMLYLLGYTVVGVSTFISFSRKWFPLVAGLVLWGILWIRSSDSWLSAWIDTGELLKTTLPDQGFHMPWKPVVGHFVLGSVGWLCTMIAFHRRDGRLSRRIDRLSNWRFASWFIAISQVAAAMVWISAMISMRSGRDNEDQDVESMAAGKSLLVNGDSARSELSGFGVYRSDFYEVVFRESQRVDVYGVFWSLDAIHEEVRKFFGNPTAPRSKIVLDTASPVMSHVSGQANWTKIRVPLKLGLDNTEFLRTVRHETAHVYIEQLSGGRARDQFNAMRMFHEGVASLVECEGNLELNALHRLTKERWACGVDSRGRVPFELLCNNDKLITIRDPNVVYPLGFIVAQALIEAGGPSAPRRFLETLKTTPLPPGAKPNELWRVVLQKCGVSLDYLVASYESQLDALATREQGFLAHLPRLVADVTVEGDEIVIRVTPHDSNVKDSILCEVERDRFVMKIPEPVAMAKQGEFRLPRSSISGNRIRILVGWSSSDSEGAIHEPWIEKTLD